MGLKPRFNVYIFTKNHGANEEEVKKRFTKSAENCDGCYAKRVIIFYYLKNFEQLLYGFKNRNLCIYERKILSY